MARPSKYTPEIADKICEIISTSSKGLKAICKDLNVSAVTVYHWLKNNDVFLNTYTRARESQADLLADEIIEIADDTSNDTTVNENGKEIANSEWINRSRLRVEARKWIASKLKPKKYADKIDIEHSGELKTVTETTIFQIKPKG